MKIYIFFCLLFILLFQFGCVKNDTEELQNKNIFAIEVANINDFDNKINLIKPGKISGSKEITVTSQVSGRVRNIHKKDGLIVSAGEPVMMLSDDIANYTSQLDRSKKLLDNTVINYNQADLSLQKTIDDAELAIEQAKNNLIVAQDTAEQILKQATNNLDFLSLDDGSQTRINIEKIIIDTRNQINLIKDNFILQKTQLDNLFTNILHETDKILGVTNKYFVDNDAFESFLSAKNISSKVIAEKKLLELYVLKNKLEGLNTHQLSNNDLLNNIIVLESLYEDLKIMINMMDEVLKNSIISTNLTENMLKGFLSTYSSFNNSLLSNRTSFFNYKNQVSSILGDFDLVGSSDDEQINYIAQQQVSSAINNAKFNEQQSKISYETSKINIKNSIFNAELALKNAIANHEMSKKNKDNQLKLLENAIYQAKINYDDAQKQFNKLSIRSPIRGTVGNVFVSEGQEVSMGMPLFVVVSSKEQVVDIFVTSQEYNYISVGQTVGIMYEGLFQKGIINTKSAVANNSILYKISIKLLDVLPLLGDVVTVYLPVALDVRTLPLNIITSTKDGAGYIYVVNSGEIQKFDIQMGKVWGDSIEILNHIPNDLDIILTDVRNFEAQKFDLKISKKNINNELKFNFLNTTGGSMLMDLRQKNKKSLNNFSKTIFDQAPLTGKTSISSGSDEQLLIDLLNLLGGEEI